MKKEFTIRKGIPVMLTAVMLSLTITLFGQTSHVVNISNNTFSPKELTISAGDTVIWKNNQGTHNVNGKTGTYPSNPESFGNNTGSGWTYMHVFNIAGNYDYRCDPHYSLGMTGKIFVDGTATGYSPVIPATTAGERILIYPNPATDYLIISLQSGDEEFQSIRILDLVGKELISADVPSGISYQRLNVSQFNPGLYIMQVEINNESRIFKFIKK